MSTKLDADGCELMKGEVVSCNFVMAAACADTSSDIGGACS